MPRIHSSLRLAASAQIGGSPTAADPADGAHSRSLECAPAPRKREIEDADKFGRLPGSIGESYSRKGSDGDRAGAAEYLAKTLWQEPFLAGLTDSFVGVLETVVLPLLSAIRVTPSEAAYM